MPQLLKNKILEPIRFESDQWELILMKLKLPSDERQTWVLIDSL